MYVYLHTYFYIQIQVCMYIHIIYSDIFALFLTLSMFSLSYSLLAFVRIFTDVFIVILINDMYWVFTNHGYFSCYNITMHLPWNWIIAVSANVMCCLYPTINKVYIIWDFYTYTYIVVSDLILSHDENMWSLTLKTKSCHNFVATDGAGSCHNDNIWYQ